MNKYLTNQDRILIEWEIKQQNSLRNIAAKLKRHHSTIIYEVKTKSYRGKYMASYAIEKVKSNISNRGVKLSMSQHWDLLMYIEKKYDAKDFGLKRIIREWKKENPEAPSLATLYNWVPKGLFSFGYEQKLLRPRKKKERQIKNWKRMIGRPIDLREKEVNMDEFGHWEADFIVGGLKKEKGYIFTLVEKKSRFGITQKFSSKKPEEVLEGIKKLLNHFNESIFKSITFDNGIEFTLTPELENIFKTKIYFAHPYSSWQRGQNENYNGIIRRWLPKGTNFNLVTTGELNEITWRINDMPRDILGWKCSREIFDNFLVKNGYELYN